MKRLVRYVRLGLFFAASSPTIVSANQTAPGLPGVDPAEANIVGTLYGIPELCASYRENGGLFAMAPNDDGIWWMDDKRLVGHEIYCDVRSKTKSEINFLCHYEGDETEAQTIPIEVGNGWIEIGGRRLEECAKSAAAENILSVPFDNLVKSWREAIHGCSAENDAGTDLSALREACVKLGVTTTRLIDAGYCLDTKRTEWAHCKPTLPKNAAGMWSGKSSNGVVEMGANGRFHYSTSKGGVPTEISCGIDSQVPGKFGYKVLCDNGTSGDMQFYEDGTMGFDQTLFTHGDCPNGCPE